MRRRATPMRSNLRPSRLNGDMTLVRPARRGRHDYRLGDSGRPAEVPTLLIAVFDNSGSVVSPAGNDPLLNRYSEVARAYSVIARKGSRHELAAVLHFDTPSSGDVAPTSLTRRGLLALRSGLRMPPDDAGKSELGPSLHSAFEIAEAHPGHATTLVVLSDFWLLDPDPPGMLAELAMFPGDVHAVVLGRRLPAGVLNERITTTPIGRDDPPGAVAGALFASLVTHRPGSQAVTEPSHLRM
jgi:hypothetical protein